MNNVWLVWVQGWDSAEANDDRYDLFSVCATEELANRRLHEAKVAYATDKAYVDSTVVIGS